MIQPLPGERGKRKEDAKTPPAKGTKQGDQAKCGRKGARAQEMQRHRQDQHRLMRLRDGSLKGDARAQNFEAIKAHILARRPRTVFLEVQDLHLARCGGMGTTSALTGRHQESRQSLDLSLRFKASGCDSMTHSTRKGTTHEGKQER